MDTMTKQTFTYGRQMPDFHYQNPMRMTASYLTPNKKSRQQTKKIFRQIFPSVVSGIFDAVFPFSENLGQPDRAAFSENCTCFKKYFSAHAVSHLMYFYINLIRLERDRKPSLKSLCHPRFKKKHKRDNVNSPPEFVAKNYR